MELDSEGNAERPSVRPADIGLSLEHHQPLVYEARPQRIGSVHINSVKTRKPPTSVMTAGRQSKKATRVGLDERAKVAAESFAKA